MPSPRDINLYVVYWPLTETFKVGVTRRADRVRAHVESGAEVLHTIEHSTRAQERGAHAYVGAAFDRQFASAKQATLILGPQGSGWTECFTVPRRHIAGALELALLGVRRARANETH